MHSLPYQQNTPISTLALHVNRMLVALSSSRRCLDQLHLALCRLLNLELAQKYGPKAWQANVASLDAAHKR